MKLIITAKIDYACSKRNIKFTDAKRENLLPQNF